MKVAQFRLVYADHKHAWLKADKIGDVALLQQYVDAEGWRVGFKSLKTKRPMRRIEYGRGVVVVDLSSLWLALDLDWVALVKVMIIVLARVNGRGGQGRVSLLLDGSADVASSLGEDRLERASLLNPLLDADRDTNDSGLSDSLEHGQHRLLTRITRRGAPVVVIAGKALLVVWGQEFVLEYALLAFLLSGE